MRLYKRRKDGGGPWWFAFHHRGRACRKSTGTTDRQAAQEYADHYRAQLWRVDRLGERPAVTWDTAVLDWLAAHQHLRALADRKDQLRWASKHLTGQRIDAIDRARLEDLGRSKAKEGVADSTVNRYLAAISGVLSHARRRGWLASVPAIPKRPEAEKRLRWATQEQAATLIAALSPHLAAKARFSLATGLRRRNVARLEWAQVDLSRRVAWVHADEAKGARTLAVPLNAAALAVLRAQRGQHQRFVFPYHGRPTERIDGKAWGAACKAAGLAGFRWHDLRHTWASWHVQNGTPLAVLQELGGWRSLVMVQRYAHLGPSHLAAYAGNAALREHGQNRGHGPDGKRGGRAA